MKGVAGMISAKNQGSVDNTIFAGAQPFENVASHESFRNAAVAIGRAAPAVEKEEDVSVHERLVCKLAARIQDNSRFIEDLIRIGAGSPEDIAHLANNIALDAKEVEKNYKRR